VLSCSMPSGSDTLIDLPSSQAIGSPERPRTPEADPETGQGQVGMLTS
jgi:hypothetical protein